MHQLRRDLRLQLIVAGPLTDPGDPNDPTVIVRFDRWRLGGERTPRLALHVHGDDAARARAHEIAQALSEVSRIEPPMSLAELSDQIEEIASSLGLKGYAGELRCAADPLRTAIDCSIYATSESDS